MSLASAEPVPVAVSRVGGVAAVVLFAVLWFWPELDGLSPGGQRLAAATTLMAVCWMTQALPMEVTSLLPLALFPVLGIQSAKAVAANYFSDASFLYLGGFLIALAIEKWHLHRRIALTIVSGIGVGTRRIVLGLMLATFTISMWISNTASALMMIPIGLALLDSLKEYHDPHAGHDPHFAHLNMAATLGIGYAATIGGMATLVGTPTNLVYGDIFRKLYPRGPELSAGQWMTVWTPFSLAFLLGAWLVLTWSGGPPRWIKPLDRRLFRAQLAELGPMTVGERWMLGLFLVTVAAWLFRTDFVFGDTLILPGWKRAAEAWLAHLGVLAAPGTDWINDSTVAMLVAVMLFLIPVQRRSDGSWEMLMDWQTASRLPWGVLLLFGGGFALADACKVTGLAEWCGQGLAHAVKDLPVWLTLLAICLLVTFLSELTSNVATANALLPMMAGTAVGLGYDPRLLMIPAALAASCGFMLPVSTPPHAIVFGTGRIRMIEMLRCGLGLNLLGAVLIVVATYVWLVPQLGIRLGELPGWVR